MGSISFINRGGSGGSIKPNIFMQESEPETKEGIWIKSNEVMNKIKVVESLSPGEGTWENLGDIIPVEFKGGAVVDTSNGIYIFVEDSVYVFDELTKTFEKKATMPITIGKGMAATIGTYIYIFGDNSSRTSAFKYNIIDNSFERLADVPYKIFGSRIATQGDDIYLVSSEITPTVAYKYNTISNTYTKLADIPYGLSPGNIAKVGNYIYLFGGNSSATRKNVYRYNIQTDTYENLNVEAPFDMHYPITVAVDNKIYILGGYLLKSCCVFDTTTNSFESLTDCPNDITNSKGCLYNNTIYIFGGEFSNTSKQVVAYTLPTIEDIPTNCMVIIEGAGNYKTQLFSTNNIEGRLLYKFSDVQYNTAEGNLDNTLPTYYGTGTEWVKFKN